MGDEESVLKDVHKSEEVKSRHDIRIQNNMKKRVTG